MLRNTLLAFGILILGLLLVDPRSEASPTTFTFYDNSAYSLGTVTLSGAAGSTSFTANSTGTYTLNPSFTVTSITINGQTVTSPGTGPITLANGAKVDVAWGAGFIELTDEGQINRPAP